MAADGVATNEVARRCGTTDTSVRAWRRRFEVDGVDGVGRIAKGRGRKSWVEPGTVAEVVRVTQNELPDDGSTHWSTRRLADRVGVGKDTVARIWRDHELKPWKVDRFKISDDPRFEETGTTTPSRSCGTQKPTRSSRKYDEDAPNSPKLNPRRNTSCVKLIYPGTVVTFTPLQGTPYMDGIGASYHGPQLPPQTTNFNKVSRYTVCYSEYAVAVAATWYQQNYLSGNILVAQRSSFLSCMRAAGVQISSTASFATIHSFFDSRAWFKNLSTAQRKAGGRCETKYGQFLSSL